MIRNRYNYLTPSSKTPQGKKYARKATTLKSKHYKQKAKMTLSFPKQWLSKIKKSPGHIYIQRHTMTEIVNHSRSTVLERSVKYYWSVKNLKPSWISFGDISFYRNTLWLLQLFRSLTHLSPVCSDFPAETNSFEILFFLPKMLNRITLWTDWGFISIHSF